MDLAPDFVDLLAAFEDAGARYLVVGGYAVTAHGHVRATEDLDLWVGTSAENAARVMAALDAFGMPPGLDPSALTAPDGPPPAGFRIGRSPIRVDVLATIAGVDFDAPWPNRLTHRALGLTVHVIGREDLLANKRAAGRPQDLADVHALTR